ncbi:unnamed protein product [Hymenolepis diminuta]|uniref:Ribonuclease H n=1 Tax=Hymenolepis diminuta TaxID=6216 RepID=A0A564YX17_HYMDI|nr:unnamed protein product [Hymenolepis diminuta]
MPFYVVKAGKTPGIYGTWSECQKQVHGFTGAIFRKFSTMAEAEKFLEDDVPVSFVRKRLIATDHTGEPPLKINKVRVVDSTAVDNLSPVAFMHDVHEPNKVLVYTDGSCKGQQNNRRAGIGVFWGENHPWNVAERLSGRQTNNRAEIECHSPGHRGKWGNEQADQLANAGADLPHPPNSEQEIIQNSDDADYEFTENDV